MSREILELRYYGDPVLRRRAEPVESVTPEIRALVEDMFECMYRERGVGLAAPQVGVPLRVFVVDVEGDGGERTKLALINPVMRRKEGSVVAEEGCLSIPGIRADVKRYREVLFEGLGEDGKPMAVPGTGLLARALQHELDHLDGVLFLDRLRGIKRELIVRRIRKLDRAGKW